MSKSPELSRHSPRRERSFVTTSFLWPLEETLSRRAQSSCGAPPPQGSPPTLQASFSAEPMPEVCPAHPSSQPLACAKCPPAFDWQAAWQIKSRPLKAKHCSTRAPLGWGRNLGGCASGLRGESKSLLRNL